jgi:RNA polymerase sigma factor (sigma-70 family)
MIETLVENRRAFLRYLERQVGSHELAEDILQEAFAKVVNRPEVAPGEEAITPWFYRLLRNAAIDHHRRQATASRRLEAFTREFETRNDAAPDIETRICGCVSRLATTLKPEYAEVLNAVDVKGMPVHAFARDRGLSVSNAGARVFRARRALKKRVLESCRACAEQGCLDCSCASVAS